MSALYRKIIFLICLACYTTTGYTQVAPWSERMTATAMSIWGVGGSWTYEKGLILKSVEKVWDRTANVTYYQYIQNNMNFFVAANGTISAYNPSQYNIDNINMGRSLLFMYNQTGIQKYKTAAETVRGQLLTHPRTNEGGFWHKQVYPYQMWLDGLYMAEPFYAEYSGMFNEPVNFDDVANQIIWMENHARDTTTGLLYHGWDESNVQSWADPVTGCSPNFWGRSLGWYAMSLVDVLDYFPASHPQRDKIIKILNRLATAIVNYQDNSTGLWYQVVDKAGQPGNYTEASASCMFVYALAKGVRMGYLDQSKLDAALTAYDGIISDFVTVDAQAEAHLTRICKVAGLGGSPYRDGSYAYYIGEPIVTDDPKGVGSFILASVEIEIAKENLATGIKKEELNKISVSPNPVTDILYVNNTSQQAPLNFTIFNSLCQPVFSGNTTVVDMSGLPSGIYYLKIEGEEEMVVRKIVKE